MKDTIPIHATFPDRGGYVTNTTRDAEGGERSLMQMLYNASIVIIQMIIQS